MSGLDRVSMGSYLDGIVLESLMGASPMLDGRRTEMIPFSHNS